VITRDARSCLRNLGGSQGNAGRRHTQTNTEVVAWLCEGRQASDLPRRIFEGSEGWSKKSCATLTQHARTPRSVVQTTTANGRGNNGSLSCRR
jgi:hypothetical protein